MTDRRARSPATRNEIVALIIVAVVLLIGLFDLWYFTRGGAEQERPREPGSTINNTQNPDKLALGPVRGEISAFEHRVSNMLSAEPVRTRPLRGSARVEIRDIRWRDPRNDGAFVTAPVATAMLDLTAAARGDFIVRDVVVNSPDVSVYQASEADTWNWERALEPLLAPPPPGSPPQPKRTAIIEGLVVNNGKVRVQLPGNDFTFLDANARMSFIQFSGPNLPAPVLQLASGATTMIRANDTTRWPLAMRNATFHFPEETVDFAAEAFDVGTTQIVDLNGIWDKRLPGYGVRATGRVPDVRFAELKPYFANAPDEGNASLRFELDPLADGGIRLGVTELNAFSGNSHATGSIRVDMPVKGSPRVDAADLRLNPLNLALVEKMTGKTLPYHGTVTGRLTGKDADIHFDVNAHLTTQQVTESFNVAVVGDARFNSTGFALRGATADLKDVPLASLRNILPSVPLKGTLSGRIALTGAPDRAPMRVNIRLSTGGGAIVLVGRVNVADSVPSYDLNGRIAGVHLAQFIDTNVPPVAMSARFTLNGSGTAPSAINARFTLFGRFSEWRTTPGDTIHARGSIANGAVTLDTAIVRIATFGANAGGRWRFVAPIEGALRYAFAFSDLTPFGAYLPGVPAGDASGSLESSGTIVGPIERPRLEGLIGMKSLHVAGFSVGDGSGKFAFALRAGLPDAELTLDARNIGTPTAGTFQSASIRGRMVAPTLNLDARADRVGGGVIQVQADGRIDPNGAREATLRTLNVDLGAGRWSLAQPANIRWANPPGVQIHGFAMREEKGVGSFALDGRVLPLSQLDFTVDANALPISDAMRMMGQGDTLATGRLSLKGFVHGPGTAPTIDMRVTMDSGTVRGVAFGNLSGQLTYGASRATAMLSAQLATGGALGIHVDAPVAVSFTNGPQFKLLDTGSLQGVLNADSVPLAALASAVPTVQEVGGMLNAHMTLTGTSQHPVLDGSAQVVRGTMLVPTLNQRFSDILADITLQDRVVTIRQARVRSGGYAQATGTIRFTELKNPVANIALQLDGFQPVGIQGRKNAEARGDLHLTGPLSQSLLTGAVTIDNGDLSMPALGRPDILDIDITDPGNAVDVVLGSDIKPNQPGWYQSLRIENMQVTMGENLWFSTEQVRVQLAGLLNVEKLGPDMRLTGTLEGQRGTFTLLAGPIVRRFDIVSAQVRFIGSTDINPVLDVTAARTIVDASGRDFEVQVHVAGTLERPSISLTTPNGTTVPESELLSVLVFGQPSIGLSNGLTSGSTLAAETLIGGASELLFMGLESSIGSELGLDVFQLRPGGSTNGNLLTAPTLVLGRELAHDVFLTVESALNVLFGPQSSNTLPIAVRIEWRLSPQWRARFGYEPSTTGRLFRGVGGLPATKPERQFSAELRRRWTY